MLFKRRIHEVTVLNHGGSQNMVLKVAHGSKINPYDVNVQLYKDRAYSIPWDFENDKVNKDHTLRVMPE